MEWSGVLLHAERGRFSAPIHGPEMVRLGWALAYRPGDDPFPRPEYEPEEAEARAAGRGMWRGTFIPPWEWRHR